MKRRVLAALLAAFLAAAAWTIGSGFPVNTSVFLDQFGVSEDGRALTFSVGVGSSMGFVRGDRDDGGGEKPRLLPFDAAWGGLNSSVGVKNSFPLELSPEDAAIDVCLGDEGCVLALQKDASSGEWRRA